MVIISQQLSFATEDLQLFHTTDPILSNDRILLLYGISSTSIAHPSSSSRIQCHVLTPAGVRSYPRLALSPNSPLYKAVECLPRDEQGDEVCRGLAFTLLKYFSELPEPAKDAWVKHSLSTDKRSSALGLFNEAHAAHLASRMVKANNPKEVLRSLSAAYTAQSLSCVDVDLILPSKTTGGVPTERFTIPDSSSFEHHDSSRHCKYASLIQLFGEPAFLPTSKICRVPSRADAINHPSSFTPARKDKVRLEIQELVGTEHNYVRKLDELVHSIATRCLEEVNGFDARSSHASVTALKGLFPSTLAEILRTNSKFLNALLSVLREKKTRPQEEIQVYDSGQARINSPVSETCVLALAECLLTWFPRFTTCYGSYMQAHPSLGKHIRIVLADGDSGLARYLQTVGEQRLMSLLIEPIQRLPRYALYIDNIVKQLPSENPSLKTFLKAKDILTAICSQDTFVPRDSRTSRLQQLVYAWPADLMRAARFITAMDALALDPPYHGRTQSEMAKEYMLLLFSGYLVVASKHNEGSLSARGLLAEIDRPYLERGTRNETQHEQAYSLSFYAWAPLGAVDFTEINSGTGITLSPSAFYDSHRNCTPRVAKFLLAPCTFVYSLQASYEGKAGRWIEEVVKARVEGRFSEMQRESADWEVRMSAIAGLDLALFTAIHEKRIDQEQTQYAPVRIVIDPDAHAKRIRPGQKGIEVVASVSLEGEGFYRVEVEVANERASRDLVTKAEFLPVLIRRRVYNTQPQTNGAISANLLQLAMHYK